MKQQMHYTAQIEALEDRRLMATYYVAPGGNDLAVGTSSAAPFKTLAKVSSLNLKAGDQVLLQGGSTLEGMLYFNSADGGTAAAPIKVGSYGTGAATIRNNTQPAIYAYNASGLSIANLNLTGRYNYKWGRFSLDAWRHLNLYPELTSAFYRSVRIALVVVAISVVLGTLMSLALVKYRFRGKGIVNMLLILPLTMPEIVLGFSLLTLFVSTGVSRGLITIIIAHVMFCVSYITTTVKARIRGFDWRLEEAAAGADRYQIRWQRTGDGFWRRPGEHPPVWERRTWRHDDDR